jgi:2-hydroxychromene-2-carboxylate isomerase
VLLGAVFKVTGGKPLPSLPLKGEYSLRDIPRSARFHGVPYHHPTRFPIAGQAPSRAFYWVNERDPALARKLARTLYEAFFVIDLDISNPEITADVAAGIGIDRSDVIAALGDETVKNKLKQEVEAAIARGVFGSPFFMIDGEPFWGVDRFDQIERWLGKGPF